MPHERTIMRFIAEIPRERFSKPVVLDMLAHLAHRLEAGELSVEDFIVDTASDTCELVDIVFDGPPGPESGRFIEAQDMSGCSVGIGELVIWVTATGGCASPSARTGSTVTRRR